MFTCLLVQTCVVNFRGSTLHLNSFSSKNQRLTAPHASTEKTSTKNESEWERENSLWGRERLRKLRNTWSVSKEGESLMLFSLSLLSRLSLSLLSRLSLFLSCSYLRRALSLFLRLLLCTQTEHDYALTFLLVFFTVSRRRRRRLLLFTHSLIVFLCLKQTHTLSHTIWEASPLRSHAQYTITPSRIRLHLHA